MRNLKLEHEQEKTKILSEALQTLATEHHELEQSLVKGTPPHHSILSEDEFYDAVSGTFYSLLFLIKFCTFEDSLYEQVILTYEHDGFSDHCGAKSIAAHQMDSNWSLFFN